MARRQFIQAGAGLTGAALSAGLWTPALAAEASANPKPIPGGTVLGPLVGFPSDTRLFHFYFPKFGQEVATITDFNGVVAAAEIQGSGTGKNTSTGVNSTLYFDADMRFVQGNYRGVDGKIHNNTFGFI